MEKLLDQQQIDAMVRAARGQLESRPASAGPAVTDCDLRHPTHLTKDQLRMVTSLHDAVSRNLTHSLGAYLRVGFEANVVSVEQLTYAEFLGRLPDVSYLCSLNVSPVSAVAVAQLDLQLGFPIIDLLLGGQGQPVGEVREATEIEEELLAGIMKNVTRELSAGWANAGLEMAFDERQLPASAQRLMRPSEKTLVISFEFQIPQVRGMMNVAFPAVVAGTLLRKLASENGPRAKTHAQRDPRLRELLLDCEFPLRLEICGVPVKLRQLLSLAPGSVLSFDHAVGDAVVASLASVTWFRAQPVRTARQRGAQLQSRVLG